MKTYLECLQQAKEDNGLWISREKTEFIPSMGDGDRRGEVFLSRLPLKKVEKIKYGG